MPERIYKLQPNRTIQLRGFDALGASAAIHHATPNSFEVSGTFRDPADFAVLVLWDADSFYEHPRLKYLPDMDFSGLTLSFDVRYENLMPLDCRKFPTIDWPYLDVVPEQGDPIQIRLVNPAGPNIVAGQNSPATASFTIAGDDLDGYDRLTLWYQNAAFDYVVPGKVRTEYPYYASGSGTLHSITIAGRTYSYTEMPNDSSADIAWHLRLLINASDPDVNAVDGSQPHMLRVERKLATGGSFTVAVPGYPAETLYHVKSETVAASLAQQIRGYNWGAVEVPFTLDATASGNRVVMTTRETGYDANFLRMYSVSKNSRLTTVEDTAVFSGGVSDATFRVTVDFSALEVARIRQLLLTFAPRLEFASDYQAREWRAVFSNWTVIGPEERHRLQVATPLSVRVDSSDVRCVYENELDWVQEEGFFSGNFARGAKTGNARVTIRYACPHAHDLWLGTSLYVDRGSVGIQVDGTARPDLDCRLKADAPVSTRRPVAAGLSAGDHIVVITTLGSQPFYFDFLEAVVAGDVPDSLPPRTALSPALDYSTDHTYKLPPERILWNLERMGFAGPVNEYLGVFWWNQRKNTGGTKGAVTLTFSGEFVSGDAVFLDIGGVTCGKSVFPNEPSEAIARHFALLINAAYVGIRAESDANRLTLRARSAHPDYQYAVAATVAAAAGSTGVVTPPSAQLASAPGIWEIDPAQSPPLNRGARDWHLDFYGLAAARGLPVTSAASMELVHPPLDFAARFPEGTPVITDVGFGGLHSTHCAFSAPMFGYQQSVFLHLASLMSQAGLPVSLQFGEFTWWYFTNYPLEPLGGMAYYDAATEEAAYNAFDRPLHRFLTPTDDPQVNGGADAVFLRSRLRDYVAALLDAVRVQHPAATFEVLFPYDVNHPVPAGVNQLGGALNRFVNLPLEWQRHETSGFDRLRIEALNFGAWSRDLDLARSSLRFPLELGWPPSRVRAMLPIFRGGYPWWKELRYAMELKLECVNLWAFDHVCLYGILLTEPTGSRSSRQGG